MLITSRESIFIHLNIAWQTNEYSHAGLTGACCVLLLLLLVLLLLPVLLLL